MGDLKNCVIEPSNLRRLWFWVQNSNPKNTNEFRHLRAASAALSLILKPEKNESGLPGIPQDLPFTKPVACQFPEEALYGFQVAILQAISGENHPSRGRAPFGSIEHLILPLARDLGIERNICMNCEMLFDAESKE